MREENVDKPDEHNKEEFYEAGQTKQRLRLPKTLESPFPIDLIYTWVNGTDPNWLKSFNEAVIEEKAEIKRSEFVNRFEDFDELRYSLRTVEKFILPWINKIHIVTADGEGQIPKWIKRDHPKLNFVAHSQIFFSISEKKSIKTPSFNTNAIEFSLINIPGLAEHFIYMNDDMYIGRPLNFSDFFVLTSKKVLKKKNDDNLNNDLSNSTTEKGNEKSIGRPIMISKRKQWKYANNLYRRFRKPYMRKYKGVIGSVEQFMTFVSHSIDLVQKEYNRTAQAEYSHVPFALTKSLFLNTIEKFGDEVNATIYSRFRSNHDIHMQTMMVQYGLITKKAVLEKRSVKKAKFFIIDNNKSLENLCDYLDSKPKMFCINVELAEFRGKIQLFLEMFVNKPSSFEVTGAKRFYNKADKRFWKNARSSRRNIE